MNRLIKYQVDSDQIVHLIFDRPDSSANLMDAEFAEELQSTVERIVSDSKATGVIIRSAKQTFFAGADLEALIKIEKKDAETVFNNVEKLKNSLRLLETSGKPVVAALNGSALGGGWEIALACHHRVAIDSVKVKFGLPEVSLGLLPGGGGIVRTTRLLGFQEAAPLLLEGKKLIARVAHSKGLIHELVKTEDELVEKARQFIKENPSPKQPWDQSGYKIPGGTPTQPRFAKMLPIVPAMLIQKTQSPKHW